MRAYRWQAGGWRGLTIAGPVRDVFAADLDGQAGAELVLLGDRPERVSLRGVRWPE